jgi:prepilin-type N-terminal cleavage/methylation domain-containing protein
MKMARRKAFTLIELLVVIAIIMILIGVVRPMLSVSASRTREFECESNLKQMSTAVRAYCDDYQAFPARLADLDSILQNKDLLVCPKTSKPYYYRVLEKNASGSELLAACIDPRSRPVTWPHRFGECYLWLTASGDVRRSVRR